MNEHLATTDRRKQKVGRVVSDKMNKTVVVAVDYLRPHPLYRKTVRKTHKFYAHDENNDCHVGDTVRIEETRPLSNTARARQVKKDVARVKTILNERRLLTEAQA